MVRALIASEWAEIWHPIFTPSASFFPRLDLGRSFTPGFHHGRASRDERRRGHLDRLAGPTPARRSPASVSPGVARSGRWNRQGLSRRGHVQNQLRHRGLSRRADQPEHPVCRKPGQFRQATRGPAVGQHLGVRPARFDRWGCPAANARAAVTRLLDALEGKALIFRRRSVADRRIVQVTVSTSGTALAARSTTAMRLYL